MVVLGGWNLWSCIDRAIIEFREIFKEKNSISSWTSEHLDTTKEQATKQLPHYPGLPQLNTQIDLVYMYTDNVWAKLQKYIHLKQLITCYNKMLLMTGLCSMWLL